jgi:octanoyl-[GcvH]:protein N-octanoyltransferase
LGVRPLRVLLDSFPEDPVFDTAVSQATMRRVAVGELPETLRLARPGRVVAFAKRDVLAQGYAAAVAAARAAGFGSMVRLAGGRAAVFHEGTLELAHAVPDPDPRGTIHERFQATAELIARALAGLGIDARVGEVAGEYCPGRWSVNAGGARKLAGIGQRVISGGAHVGTVIVAEDAAAVREVLEPVYAALDLAWDPATVGAVERPWTDVRAAVLAEYAQRFEVVEDAVDAETLALARTLANSSDKGPPEPSVGPSSGKYHPK